MTKEKIKLTMFVQSTNSGQALAHLYRALEFHDYTDYELEIIDVLNRKEVAHSQGVTETPTLIKHCANNDVRLTGDLSDVARVRTIFGFKLSK